MGGISGEFSSIPVARRRYPDNEQRIATHSLRRKMARSQAERTRPITGRQKPSPVAGVVFYRVAGGSPEETSPHGPQLPWPTPAATPSTPCSPPPAITSAASSHG